MRRFIESFEITPFGTQAASSHHTNLQASRFTDLRDMDCNQVRICSDFRKYAVFVSSVFPCINESISCLPEHEYTFAASKTFQRPLYCLF